MALEPLKEETPEERGETLRRRMPRQCCKRPPFREVGAMNMIEWGEGCHLRMATNGIRERFVCLILQANIQLPSVVAPGLS